MLPEAAKGIRTAKLWEKAKTSKKGSEISGKFHQGSLDCLTDTSHTAWHWYGEKVPMAIRMGGLAMNACIKLVAVAGSLALFAGLGQAQTLNGAPLLLSRSQANNNWLVDITKYFSFAGWADKQGTAPLAQGVNALGQQYQGPIAAPMNVRGGSGKLADYFFAPKTNLIQNQTVIGRSNFPTQAQLPGRMYLNNFGYTKFNR
jgi:hypothetical protein